MKRILGLTLVVSAMAFAACTSESTSSSSSSSGGTDASTTGDSAANGSDDASTNGDTSTTNDAADAGGGACGTVANTGSVVSETAGGGTKPTPAGGALYDGTFVLTKHEVFPPSSPDAHVRKRAFRFSGSSFEYVEEDDNDPVVRISGTVSANGPTLSLSATCPATKAGTLPYTLTSTELVMFDSANQDDVFTYTKQ